MATRRFDPTYLPLRRGGIVWGGERAERMAASGQSPRASDFTGGPGHRTCREDLPGCLPAKRGAWPEADISRERRGPRPASGEGKLELTEASCSRVNMAEGIPEGFRSGAPWKGCRGRHESERPNAPLRSHLPRCQILLLLLRQLVHLDAHAGELQAGHLLVNRRRHRVNPLLQHLVVLRRVLGAQ